VISLKWLLRQKVVSAEEDPKVETVFDDEAEAEEDAQTDGPSLSEQDEALTDGDESSYGDSSNFAAAPNLQKLVQLELGHCRSPCCITDKDGIKIPIICGKKTLTCQQHAKHCMKCG
jgi:hypothetical protein